MRGLRRRHELGSRRQVGNSEEQPGNRAVAPVLAGIRRRRAATEGQYWPALILAIAATAES